LISLAPAVWPDRRVSQTRLLCVDPDSGGIADLTIDELPWLLRPGDLVVVNDAATLPASLPGLTRHGLVELRLCGVPLDGHGSRWAAVVFGPGDWRQRTEDRSPPPRLPPGERVELEAAGPGRGLFARVFSVSPVSTRLVELQFDRRGAELWAALFRIGRPVQYSYVRDSLPLWHVQTAFAGRPFAAEMPSAGRALRLPLLRALRARGIGLARVTHAAGLSSTGDATLDRALPLPEASVVPAETAADVRRTQARGGRVLAVGTSVVRALEGASSGGKLAAGAALRAERIGPGHVPRVVSGLLTGVHSPGESHFDLLQAFVPSLVLEAALAHAAAEGYLAHEFGDAMLVLSGSARAPSRSRPAWPGGTRCARPARGRRRGRGSERLR
jgi:S-adenosylmethionine:tRNA ribosyltransferase-isomerase